ncbi:hypothetical protein DFH05DRAFT_479592 [Lentinula detonsa]|uniref:Uncharacterized protein n=1 Tax=Lentinula detonsa TaxID=2804962 RepID=A0A9W8NSK6_9AGAR|nr:hypothetical protein DFH05DRAFT_479592 [Lentinula detonsa]
MLYSICMLSAVSAYTSVCIILLSFPFLLFMNMRQPCCSHAVINCRRDSLVSVKVLTDLDRLHTFFYIASLFHRCIRTALLMDTSDSY